MALYFGKVWSALHMARQFYHRNLKAIRLHFIALRDSGHELKS